LYKVQGRAKVIFLRFAWGKWVREERVLKTGKKILMKGARMLVGIEGSAFIP